MKNILCLDLGTTTGWAATSGGTGVITSGVCSFKPGRYEGGGMRYLRFVGWLNSLAEPQVNALPDLVFYEEVRRHAATDAAHVYGGLLATLTQWCEYRSIPYQGIPVGTIKKHATGRGNANKRLMMIAAQEKGHNPQDDNEADALCLLYYALDTQQEFVVSPVKPHHTTPHKAMTTSQQQVSRKH